MKHPLRTLLLAVCCGLAAACTQRQERLKLMSYNIRNGIGIDNIQDIGRIARVILREAPDHRLAAATRRAMTLRFAQVAARRIQRRPLREQRRT